MRFWKATSKKQIEALALVRKAGCKCKNPEITRKPALGPRCKICDTQAVGV